MQDEYRRAYAGVGLRVLASEIGADRRQFLVRLRRSDTGGEAAQRLQVMRTANDSLLRGHAKHAPHLRRASRLVDQVRHDADDLEDVAVQPDRASDRAGVAAESCPPEGFADDRDVSATRLVTGHERPSSNRTDTEDVEEAGRDPRRLDPVGLSRVRQIHRLGHEGGRRRERSAARDPVVVIGRRDDISVPVVVLPELHQSIGVRVGQRAQEDLAHDREHRRVRADAERQGRDRRSREAAVARDEPHTLSQIVQHACCSLKRCASPKGSRYGSFRDGPRYRVAWLQLACRGFATPTRPAQTPPVPSAWTWPPAGR